MAKVYSSKTTSLINTFCQRYSTKCSPNLETLKQADLIGPPDQISNLRPVTFAKPGNETIAEKQYRKAREDTQAWNQNFWTKHNTSFVEERKEFQRSLKAQGKDTISADDMSVFYKGFLDKNWRSHFNYNLAWYRRNIHLLFLELRVRLSKLKFK